MPQFSKRSLASLIEMATLLGRSARAVSADPIILGAVERLALALTVAGDLIPRKHDTERDRGHLSRELMLAEVRVDRQLGAVGRVLDGRADLGETAAREVFEKLFPAGITAAFRPTGRAQIPEYQRILEVAESVSTHPGLRSVADVFPAVIDSLRALNTDMELKVDQFHERSATVAEVAAATESLRGALQALDTAVALVGGGKRSTLYRQWAEPVRGR